MLGLKGFISKKKEGKYSKVEEIYIEYKEMMLRIALAILRDYDLAEDAVSESLMKLLKNVDNIGETSCHKTASYIATIVRNTSINMLKKQNRINSISDEILNNIADKNHSVLDDLISIEVINDIMEILEKLPTTLRDASIMYLYNELGYEEIATILGVNNDTVRQRLSRSKKAIKRILSGNKKRKE